MKKSLIILGIILAAILTLSISYYFAIALPSYNQQKLNLENDKLKAQLQSELKAECKQELKDKQDTLDKLVNSMGNLTKEEMQSLGRRMGLVDKKGFLIDNDILINECMQKKSIN